MEKHKSNSIRDFIIDNVKDHPTDITNITIEKFGLSRQSILRYINALIKEKILSAVGKTKDRKYFLTTKDLVSLKVPISSELQEDSLWRTELDAKLRWLPENIYKIFHYGFTEMFNNVIDHSEASTAMIKVETNAKEIEMNIHDDGIGIFKKIKDIFNLEDERHAILELSKGKLTTDPANHSGEGIFFTSKIFDTFEIISSNLYFGHANFENNWLVEAEISKDALVGTHITLAIDLKSNKKLHEVFDEFSSEEDDYQFNKTVVPVKLAKYGNENLVSRSQAKRLLNRVGIFKIVIFDFKDVGFVGQAFTDEIFRVFQNNHPETKLLSINTDSQVQKMISRAKSNLI